MSYEMWLYRLGPEREEELDQIGRYSFYTFIYRTSDAHHVRRVEWLCRIARQYINPRLVDFPRVMAMARIHDDAEIDPRFGDVQAALKAVMTSDATQQNEDKEAAAIDYVVKRFGTDDPETAQTYRGLLEEARARQTPEAQVVKYLDKIDAWCEAVHELLAGNTDITVNKPTPYGQLAPVPFQYYLGVTAKLIEESPFLSTDLGVKMCPLFQPLPVLDYLALVQDGRPHTKESVLEQDQHLPIYSDWIEMLFDQALLYDPSWLWTPNTRQFANCP